MKQNLAFCQSENFLEYNILIVFEGLKMRSLIDRTCPPPQKEHYFTFHSCPIKVKCQSMVDDTSSAEENQSDEPYIQNFLCYTANNELIKVTKIRIGREIITMADRITFESRRTRKALQKNSNQASSPLEVESSSDSSKRKLKISVIVRSLVKLLEEWIKQNEPEFIPTFNQVKEKSRNETDLRQMISQNGGLRELFFRFKEYFISTKPKRGIRMVFYKWEKFIEEAQERYIKNQQFLNSVLNVSSEQL